MSTVIHVTLVIQLIVFAVLGYWMLQLRKWSQTLRRWSTALERQFEELKLWDAQLRDGTPR